MLGRRRAIRSFNPRARTGRDPPFTAMNYIIKFQSTRPHGARPLERRRIRSYNCFNPRARTGRDQRCCQPQAVQICFNPRARTGRDRHILVSRSATLRFNPRARTGRDTHTPS